MSKTQAAKTFGVSRYFVKRYAAANREGRPLTPKQHRGSKPKLGEKARRLLKANVENRHAVTLIRAGQVVMDNLSSHKGSRVKELIEERGCELLYLPPYSPDLNLIEEAFSKVKEMLRRAQARGREALTEAMSEALSVISSSAARSFFAHRGYHLLVQQL